MHTSEGRPLTEAEARLVRWLLERGAAGATRYLPEVDTLRVVDHCSCGCASIDFTTDHSGPMSLVADFGVEGPEGPLGGVFLFTREGRLAGLEVRSWRDAPISRIPDPASLYPWS